MGDILFDSIKLVFKLIKKAFLGVIGLAYYKNKKQYSFFILSICITICAFFSSKEASISRLAIFYFTIPVFLIVNGHLLERARRKKKVEIEFEEDKLLEQEFERELEEEESCNTGLTKPRKLEREKIETDGTRTIERIYF